MLGKLLRTTCFQKWKEKHEKIKQRADISGVCPIRDNERAHKCKLVQNFLEMETVVQLPNLPYSPNLSPCDFFPVYFTEVKFLHTSM